MNTTSSSKTPSRKALATFIKQWRRAQNKRDTEHMNRLLHRKYFRYWWALLYAPPCPLQSTAEGAVERILQDIGLLKERPEKPSERAMRIAEQFFNS